MKNYYWSPTTKSFYPVVLVSAYQKAGTFPADAVLVEDSVFQEYGIGQPPANKTRSADANGMPAWG